MRHLNKGRKLGRNSTERKAMFRNMVTSLLVHGRIRTTKAKAAELRPIAERVITLGKQVAPSGIEGLAGDELARAKARRLHHIRRAGLWVLDPDALHRLFDEYAERYKARPGGYTRIVKAGWRGGDNAQMAIIELVDHAPPVAKKKRKPAAAEGEPAAEAKPEEAKKESETPASPG